MRSSRLSVARAAIETAPTHRSVASGSGSGSGTSSKTAGALAAATWLMDRAITAPIGPRWHVEIALDVMHGRPPTDYDEETATRFHLNIYAAEWGVYFCHLGKASWIRVTDVAFVHGKDDYQLLAAVPALKRIGVLLRQIERDHRLMFQRQHASVVTNLANAEPAIRTWVASL